MKLNLLSATWIGIMAGLCTLAAAQQSPPKVKVYESAAPQAVTAPSVNGVTDLPLGATAGTSHASRKGTYNFTANADEWTDTGVEVQAGDPMEFSATGTLTLSDGRTATPDGVPRGWKDLLRNFPLNTAQTGELIGRMGLGDAAVPFAIGAQKAVTAPVSGELFVRANVSSDLSREGSFAGKVKLSAATAAGKDAAVRLSQVLAPALFADIPRRVSDQQGDPGDMVNFALIGTDSQVTQAFASAGWTKTDKTTQDAIVHGLEATLSHKAYTDMPMSTLYLFGRPQDYAYARADPLEVAAVRNHLRVWKTTETVNGQPLWVGSATHDNGFETDQRNNGVTHHIDPNIDAERDFIEQSFAAAGVVAAAAYVMPSHPLTTAKTATGGSFHSDGRIVVMLLK
ncbi:LssY C-terminal domain-containing protein [Acidipila rosea]|uniref:LssY-like putative type I secretion system component LssY n=1 Tax=Acidipila rosea TaxID=768535 RepID=A0A4R1L0V6_9BACT|nr:LssY C-terminal domain-containing protein [Acidipila rosea]TCK71548.1 LssY-like putative type I secretion system component LssY [Acidipila rosea]